MSAGTSEFFCLICLLVCSCRAQTNFLAEEITAELGQDVILPCKFPNINNIIAVKWTRPDQDPEYVLLYRDGRLHPENQHPSYQNRVDLNEEKMKDGNFSLILENVMKNDTGRYKCRVYEIETNNGKRYNKTTGTSIYLEVHGEKFEGDQDGIIRDGGNKTGIIVGPVVGVIVLLSMVSLGFL